MDEYVKHHGIETDAFAAHVLKRCLYPHARPIAWILPWMEPRVFVADYDMIQDLGTLRREPGFKDLVKQWSHHPDNRGVLRLVFHLRLSIRRLRREVEMITAAGDVGGKS